jgi:hypothetical protein
MNRLPVHKWNSFAGTIPGARERQKGDPGLAGVLVSNGREVVRTGPDGGYSLPIEDGMAVAPDRPGHGVSFDWAGLEAIRA